MIRNLIPLKKRPSQANNFLTIKQVEKDLSRSQAVPEKKRIPDLLIDLNMSQASQPYQKKHLPNFPTTEFNHRKLNHSSINFKKQ